MPQADTYRINDKKKQKKLVGNIEKRLGCIDKHHQIHSSYLF